MKIWGDFKELQSIPSPTTDNLNFGSQEFRVVRVVLRLLSLWRPRSAGFLESYIYPVFVNLLLLVTGIIRNSIQATEKSTWLNIQLLYTVHEVGIWLGHILGNRYFASRDLETNVLRPDKPLTGIAKPLNRRLKVLNICVIVSMVFFSLMLVLLFVLTEFKWNEGHKRFSGMLPHVHGAVDHVLYGFVIVSIVYNLGVGLALSWTLALLYSGYAARLKILENIFIKWKHSSVDAVSFFTQSYARPVKNSWKRMSLWFLAHNIVALAIPLYGYELAQAVSGRAYHAKHLPQFICYLLFIVAIWLAPIFMSEQIKRRERKFQERINDISPWLLEAETRSHPLSENRIQSLSISSANEVPQSPRQTASQDSVGSSCSEESEGSAKYSEYTFVCRGKELTHFMRFLKDRTPGLVSRGYSLQLNISLISLVGGAVSFLTELKAMTSDYTMYGQHCNCTIS